MGIRELVDFVQSTYPPSASEALPQGPGALPQGQQPTEVDEFDDREFEDLFPNLPPTQRPSVPDWVQPGEGTEFPVDGELTPEGNLPQNVQIAPGAIDALAYYLPFHFYRHDWGIYLRASGMLSVESMLAGSISRRRTSAFSSLARDILIQHERFHFLSEVACSRGEVAIENALYRRYFTDGGSTTLEEGLSNARVIRTALCRKPPAIRSRVETWMHSQGPGYRDFARWLSSRAFGRGCESAARRMLGHRLGRANREPSGFLFAGLARAQVPMYLVRDVPGVGALKPFQKDFGMRVLVHTNEHPPPHFHLEKPPGRNYTRLEWPTLTPLRGEPSLSRREQKSLEAYLSKYGRQIGAKIGQVYPSAS